MKNIKPPHISNIHERQWLIPYMGDGSFIGAAVMRSFGIRAEVLPTHTSQGYELSRKHIQTEVCHPLKVVAGDTLDYLSRLKERYGKAFVEGNYLVVLPTASGPCRFGKYQELIRMFMDAEGFHNVPIGGPTTVSDYSDILNSNHSESDKMRLQQRLLKGITATDLLDDITLRTRPYAKDKQEVNALKTQRLKSLEKIVEKGADTSEIIRWGEETVRFYSAYLSSQQRFPLVVYSGEVFMRQHDQATGNVVERLEEQGLEVVRTSLMEWVEYVNKTSTMDSKENLWRALKRLSPGSSLVAIKRLVQQMIKGAYIHSLRQRITLPFHDVLEGRHTLPKPLEIITTLQREHEFSGKIRGESPLSIGIAYYLMNNLVPRSQNQICGMFHVGPFTCMQEEVAKDKIDALERELREHNPDLLFPIIHSDFGDSPNPNLPSEIAVFREQCYQKRELLNN